MTTRRDGKYRNCIEPPSSSAPRRSTTRVSCASCAPGAGTIRVDAVVSVSFVCARCLFFPKSFPSIASAPSSCEGARFRLRPPSRLKRDGASGSSSSSSFFSGALLERLERGKSPASAASSSPPVSNDTTIFIFSRLFSRPRRSATPTSAAKSTYNGGGSDASRKISAARASRNLSAKKPSEDASSRRFPEDSFTRSGSTAVRNAPSSPRRPSRNKRSAALVRVNAVFFCSSASRRRTSASRRLNSCAKRFKVNACGSSARNDSTESFCSSLTSRFSSLEREPTFVAISAKNVSASHKPTFSSGNSETNSELVRISFRTWPFSYCTFCSRSRWSSSARFASRAASRDASTDSSVARFAARRSRKSRLASVCSASRRSFASPVPPPDLLFAPPPADAPLDAARATTTARRPSIEAWRDSSPAGGDAAGGMAAGSGRCRANPTSTRARRRSD